MVSLSRVWRAGVSCFQYIVAVYPEKRVSDENDIGNNESDGGDKQTQNFTDNCTDWPLIVIGDSGTNRVLVYLHCKDKFTEIALPVEKQYGDDDVRSTMGTGKSRQRVNRRNRRKWPTPPIRDIMYVVPLYPRTSRYARLLITYHGCREVYKLRLQVSSCGSFVGNATPPVTGTLTVVGQKPCRMVILGADRRKTDVDSGVGDFIGGGTTVYFRLENTNDIWSWDVSTMRNNGCGTLLLIDERDFRLVRVGRTCRVPVAVSTAAVVAAAGSRDNNTTAGRCHRIAGNAGTAPEQVRQLLWMLETNFVDHFSGTADRMGVNAKLQPIETSPSGDENSDGDGEPARSRLRVQPNHMGQTTLRSSFCRGFSALTRQTG